MHAVEEAVRLLTEAGRAYGSGVASVVLPVQSALGCVLADDIASSVAVPPRDNSAMDGYAFRYADAQYAGFKLPVSQRIPAGTPPLPLMPGSAARIFTGAEIPDGADTVAMQENCQLEGGHVYIADSVKAGANIRPSGQDVRAGEVILRAGRRLRPQEMGLLASVGRGEVCVRRPLRVAVFSTGDELVEPGRSLGPGQIYNSNRATLSGLLAAWRMEMIDCGTCRDTPEAVQALLERIARDVDVVVTSGGVSVGEEDHVKGGVERLGFLQLWKVAIKPGKPLAFGEVMGTPFIGLPGNPASVFVTALIMLRPFLFAMAGAESMSPQAIKLRATFSRRAGGREEYLRAKRVADGVEIFPNQSSGMLSSACWGDGLVRQAVGEAVSEGDLVEFLPYSAFI